VPAIHNTDVSLFYLSDNTTGGWVTFTAHLMMGLSKLPGIRAAIYKVKPKHENRPRPFGYNMTYRNIDLQHAIKLANGLAVVVALQKNYREVSTALVSAGSWLVVHDPAEFTHTNLAEFGNRCFAIRRSVQRQISGSTLLPHPYHRHYPKGTIATGKLRACSVARIDFDKNTTILLDANRLLSQQMKIRIHGFENRLYTKFKVCPQYPEWQQSISHYSREVTTAANICHQATFTCDMSLIKGDGGGTQYSFMEAMDAGSVCVVHRGWIIPDDEMRACPDPKANCIAVGNGRELAEVLQRGMSANEIQSIVRQSDQLLEHHKDEMSARTLVDVLTA